MRRAFWLSGLFLVAAPAAAHDHQWCYDRSEWQADVARGRALVRLSNCDSALLADARRQFDQMDEQIMAVYRQPYQAATYSPAPAPAAAPPAPAPPRPGGEPGTRR